MLWQQKRKTAKKETRSRGRRRRSGHGGTGTMTATASDDIDHEAAREIENAATDTKTDATTTRTTDAGTDREVANTGDEMSVQSVAKTTVLVTLTALNAGAHVVQTAFLASGRDRVQEINGTSEARGADHHSRGLRGEGNELSLIIRRCLCRKRIKGRRLLPEQTRVLRLAHNMKR
jgi:hypothetical protein